MINLETSITTSNNYWQGKGIHYRMHPENITCLTVAKIDYCSLANNHVLDWGYGGLAETLETLKHVNIKGGGGGQNLHEAEMPAVIEVEGKGRVTVFSYGLQSSGIPSSKSTIKSIMPKKIIAAPIYIRTGRYLSKSKETTHISPPSRA